MRYYIPMIDTYIDETQAFVIDGATYPPGSIKILAAELGAQTPPAITATQRLVEASGGWQTEDIPQEELDAATATLVLNAQNQLWYNAWNVWGEQQLAAVDRATIGIWAGAGVLTAAGITMAQAIIHWHDDVFANYYLAAKNAIVVAGGWVEPDWSSWPTCPYTFYDVYAERNDLG